MTLRLSALSIAAGCLSVVLALGLAFMVNNHDSDGRRSYKIQLHASKEQAEGQELPSLVAPALLLAPVGEQPFTNLGTDCLRVVRSTMSVC